MTTNPFRSSGGNRYLEALFYERGLKDKSPVLYTLKDRDHEVDGRVIPSLYRLYMEANDPLEWRFANTYLEGWEHWQMLCNCSWFKPYVSRWRYELELKIRSEALIRLREDAQSESRSAARSNLVLLQRGWDVEKNTKGRPSKTEIKKAADELAETRQTLDHDYQRVMLTETTQ